MLKGKRKGLFVLSTEDQWGGGGGGEGVVELICLEICELVVCSVDELH